MLSPVSIVVPVFNLEGYVGRCLASLVVQTLPNVEVIVVDDGGSDGSGAIIESFAREHPDRIRAFRKDNGGHGSACNYGIERATGEYVMIVDGDDFLEPTVAAEMYAHASRADADLVIGNLRYHYPEGRTDEYRPLPIRGERLLEEADWPLLFLNWATPCARLYRRRLFLNDERLRFRSGILFADVNFCPKSYLAAERILYVDRILYEYDCTRPTQSIKQTDRRVLDVIPALRDMLDYFRAHGRFDECRAELLEYTVRHCVAWVSKVENLADYSRRHALRELFAVLDDHFGSEWVTSKPLRDVAGVRRAALLAAARQIGYVSVVWAWELRTAARALDDKVERAFGESGATRAYRRIRGGLDRMLFNRLLV